MTFKKYANDFSPPKYGEFKCATHKVTVKQIEIDVYMILTAFIYSMHFGTIFFE